MNKSPFGDEWSPGKLYRITLNQAVSGASLYGFRGKDRSQERYFKDREAIDNYIGELWLYGLDDVTIEEIQNE